MPNNNQWLTEILDNQGYCYEHSDCEPECLGTKANKEAVKLILQKISEDKEKAVREVAFAQLQKDLDWVISEFNLPKIYSDEIAEALHQASLNKGGE